MSYNSTMMAAVFGFAIASAPSAPAAQVAPTGGDAQAALARIDANVVALPASC